MGISGTIAKNTTFAFITSILELGISFMTGILLARGLGTGQYGLYSYLIWLVGLALIINNLGLGEMSRRFIPEAIGRQSTREQAGFVQFTMIFRSVAALVICFAILISSGYWARLSGEPSNRLIFIVAALSTLPNALQQALEAIFKGFQKFDYSLYLSLAIYPMRLALIMVFMTLGFGVMAVFILTIVTLILGVVIGFFLLSRLVPLKSLLSPSLLSSDRKKQALKSSMTVAGIMVLSYLVSQQAETFCIGLYCSVEDVGFYTLAFRIGSLAGLLPAAFAYVLLSVIAEQFGKGEMEKMKRVYLTSLRYLMAVALPLATGGIVLASSLITLLYGADYRPVILIFQIICLPIAFSSIAGAGDTVIRGINRPGFLLKMTAIFAILNVGLSLWLIPKYGILGATIVNVVIMALGLPVNFVFINKTLGATWPVRDTIKIALASLIMGVAVYAIQSHLHLGVAVSLALCIPLGLVIYIIAIFVLRVIQEEDLIMLKKFQGSLPRVLRKNYATLMSVIEMFVGRKRAAADVDSHGNIR